MDVKEQLIREKAVLLSQIADSARRGASQEILVAGERLQRIESLIERYEALLRDISNICLENAGSELPKATPGTAKLMTNARVASGRGIGKSIRIDFLEKIADKGIRLEHVRSSIYRTQSGRKIGIAVATERKPDRWFLGLPTGSFDHAVLLCQGENYETVEICLPKPFFEEYGSRISQSGGQMKFNIVRRGTGYSILVPGTDGVSISRLIGDYSQLN